ncbi:hypothetical protein JCM8547_008020 [Rhodosporidiobolus lusitaniae]
MPFRAPIAAQHPSALSPPRTAPPSTLPTPHGTLRLPAPPPPPKPLHLTMSVRGRAAAFENGAVSGTRRGWGEEGEDNGEEGSGKSRASKSSKRERMGMPRWSVIETENGEGDEEGEDDEEGTVKAKTAREEKDGSEEVDKREAQDALAGLFAVDKGGEAAPEDEQDESENGSGIYRTPVGTLRPVLSSSSNGGTAKRASTIKFRSKDGRLSIFFDPSKENPFLPPSPSPSTAKKSSEDKKDFSLPTLSSSSPLSFDSSAVPSSPSPSSARSANSSSVDDPLTSLPPSLLLSLPASSTPAVALHAFTGEPSFGELTFSQGDGLRVEVEDLGGGWSLGWVESEGEEGRGLIPRGWYAYIDLPAPPPSSRPVAPSRLVDPASPVNPTSAPELRFATDSVVASPELAVVALPPLSPSASPPSPSSPFLKPDPSTPSALSPHLSTANDLTAPSPPSTPSYPTRSIGRHVVVSGIEFEPIPGTPVVEQRSPSWNRDSEKEGGRAEEEELTVEEMVRRENLVWEEAEREEEEAKRRAAAEADEGYAKEEAESGQEKVKINRTSTVSPADDLLTRASNVPIASPPSSLAAAPVQPPRTPPPPSSRPPPVSGSFLFRLGLTSSPSSSSAPGGFSLTLPLLGGSGRTTVPGGTILAQTGAEPSTPPRKKRLPRLDSPGGKGAGGEGGVELVMKWVGEGDELDEQVLEEQEKGGGTTQVWDIEAGPAWKPLSEPFVVHIRDPVKHSPFNQAPYTTFALTTVFSSSSPSTSVDDEQPEADDPLESPPSSFPLSLTVHRRYSHFHALSLLLSSRFLSPLLSLPPLPPKAFGATRFSEAFVEQRRRDLESWVGRLGGHPVVGESEELRGFLSIEGDKELLTHLHVLRPPHPAPPLALFPAHVFHPEFNLDLHEAEELVDRFERYCQAVEIGGGWKEVESEVRKGREGERASAIALQSFSSSLIRLAAGLALPPSSYDRPAANDEPDYFETDVVKQQRRAREWGLQNGEGGMGWKEDPDALSLAKAVQATAETLASIADIKDDSARNALLAMQEILHEQSAPFSQYQPLFALHRTLLSTYARLSRLSSSDTAAHDALGRCETALNITCAEMERIRVERGEDLKRAMEGWLDAVIEVQEQSLSHLRYARDHFSPSSFPSLALTGPRLRSTLEARAMPVVYPPLPQPTTSFAGGGVGSAALGLAGAAVGSVFSSTGGGGGGGGAGAGGKGGLRRANTAAGTGVRTPLWEEEEDGEDVAREEAGTKTWRESLYGTLRLWQ